MALELIIFKVILAHLLFRQYNNIFRSFLLRIKFAKVINCRERHSGMFYLKCVSIARLLNMTSRRFQHALVKFL